MLLNEVNTPETAQVIIHVCRSRFLAFNDDYAVSGVAGHRV